MKQSYQHLLNVSDFYWIDNAELFVLTRVTVREVFFLLKDYLYTTLTNFITKYHVTCKVYTDGCGIK